MAMIYDHDDCEYVDLILADLKDAGVLSGPIVVYGHLLDAEGSITIAAATILRCVMHFFRWDGDVFRETGDMLDMLIHINTEEIFPKDGGHEDGSREDAVTVVCNTIRDSIIAEHASQLEKGDVVIGVDLVLAAIFHTMHHPGDDIPTAYRYCDFISRLDIKLINSTNGDVHSTIKYDRATNLGEYWDKLEGMMAAMVLYPLITYRLTIGGAMLIPKYDSSVQLSNVIDDVITTHRMLVVDSNFTDHYLNEQRRSRQARTTEAGYSYIGFEFSSFTEGMVTLTKTIGVDQPWQTLELGLQWNTPGQEHVGTRWD